MHILIHAQGLCDQSRHVVAVLPYKSPGESSVFLSLERGDVITVPTSWVDAELAGWAHGTCHRTGKEVGLW